MLKKIILISVLITTLIIYFNSVSIAADIERPITPAPNNWSNSVGSVGTEYTIDSIKDTLINNILKFVLGIIASIAIMIIILNIVKRFLSVSEADIAKANKVIIGIAIGLLFILLSYTIIDIITKFWPST